MSESADHYHGSIITDVDNSPNAIYLPTEWTEIDTSGRLQRWGEWNHAYERIEEPKNLAFTVAEHGLRIALEYRDPERVREVVQNYRGYYQNFEDLGTADNRLFAILASANVESYHLVLDDILDREETLSPHQAREIITHYLQYNILTIESMLAGEHPTAGFSRQMAPFLIETSLQLHRDMESLIQNYQDFRNSDDNEQGVYQAVDRIVELQQQLSHFSEESIPELHEEGWLFFASGEDWPLNSKRRLSMYSHVPDFGDIKWYCRKAKTAGGVLIKPEKSIGFYSTDMGTTQREELGIYERAQEIYNRHDIGPRAKSRLYTALRVELRERELVKQYGRRVLQQRPDILIKIRKLEEERRRRYECSSLEEAWEKKGERIQMYGFDPESELTKSGYTELWGEVRGSTGVYAIWVDRDWQEVLIDPEPAHKRNNYALRKRNLIHLLQKRPDLPVVDLDGNVIPRQAIDQIYTSNHPIEQFQYSPKRAIQDLKNTFPELSHFYALDADMWQGYSVQEITEMTMLQFEKYFGEKATHPCDMLLEYEEMHDLLALRNITKGIDGLLSHSRKKELRDKKITAIGGIVEKLGYQPDRAHLIGVIASQNWIRDYIEGNRRTEEIMADIQQVSEHLHISPDEFNLFFNTIEALYFSEASARTVDAYTEDGLHGTEDLDTRFAIALQTHEIAFSENINPHGHMSYREQYEVFKNSLVRT